MLGRVNSRLEATLQVELGSPNGQLQLVTLVIDTGFNGHLALPEALVASLGLPLLAAADATLADGREVPVSLFAGVVSWDGVRRDVIAVQTEGGMLLGMALLEGSRLRIDVASGGEVLVDRLPSPSA